MKATRLEAAAMQAFRLTLEDVKVIFSQKPKVASSAHVGCRIVESQTDGMYLAQS
jgi:hypothetical protein